MADQSKKYKFDISNLNLHYGDFHALKDVNMQIETNKITAFIGPSGCGKSTFLKTLNRMNDLVENCKIDGKVLLDGTDIYKDMDEITLRYRVGMVFQQPNPFPKSVYDNVAYGPRIAGIKKKSQLDEIVERSLRQAAIWDELKDRLHFTVSTPDSWYYKEDNAKKILMEHFHTTSLLGIGLEDYDSGMISAGALM